MAIRLALQTLQAIDTMLEVDQGNKYRGQLGKIMHLFRDAFRDDEDGFRSHLGASIVGRECAREVYLNFRWYRKSKFDGKTLRLFQRGHLQEPLFVALLLASGHNVYVQEEDGTQMRFQDFGGHMGGSLDGVVTHIAELPKSTSCLFEAKTHGDKSFVVLAGKNWLEYVKSQREGGHAKFTGDGVKEAKYEHYVQMQLYMKKKSLPFGLYMAVNKNTDAIYAEIIDYDPVVADQYLERGGKVIFAEDTPPRMPMASLSWFKCRFCDFRELCFATGNEEPARNCRTCVFAKPLPDGTWLCGQDSTKLDKARQLVGCEFYKLKVI